MNYKIDLPSNVKFILDMLHNNNFEGYVVGGCVRDSLLGIKPKDWDITTNALPDNIANLFEKTIQVNEKYGTVIVLLDNEQYEVTTYRKDGNYTDNRHPEDVKFVDNLELDLSRRDFTINALAYNEEYGIIDKFGGLNDLHEKIIRCVGVPQERFKEDYLRIIRCFRFSIKYCFNIERFTYMAAEKLLQKHVLNELPRERVGDEFFKIMDLPIESDFFGKFHRIMKFIIVAKLRCKKPYQAMWHIFEPLDLKERIVWLFGFFDISLSRTKKILMTYNYGMKNIDIILDGMRVYRKPAETLYDLKQQMSKYGFESVSLGYKVLLSEYPKESMYNARLIQAKAIEDDNIPVRLDQLAVNGNNIMSYLNIPESPKIGKILKCCLEAVMKEKVENSEYELLQYAKSLSCI